mgnify:CR=1 FL=1
MAYKAVTDGAVTRFYDQSNPKSRSIFKELINEKTGYDVIADEQGYEREFTEDQVKNIIEKVEASNVKPTLKPKTKSASKRFTTVNDF